MKTYDVAIIGGGHNGLACGALLAKSGRSVAIFERSSEIGGAAITESPWPGYTVSAASYVCSLLDPELVQSLDLHSHGYHAYRKDPASFTPLGDGRSLLLGQDAEANAREISGFCRDDVAGFSQFERIASQLGSELFETFEDADPQFDRFSRQTQAMLRTSAADLVERCVQTPVLQATLATDGLIGTFAGPRSPGTGYVLAHHYAGRAMGAQGAWGFVRGGMGSISRALASSALANGAQIFTDSPVARVVVREGRASHIVLHDGTLIGAKAIASNAHPVATFLEFLEDRVLDEIFLQRVRNWKSTGPSLKVNFALGELPNFSCRPGSNPQAHHRATIHVAPTIEYLQTAFEDGIAGRVSRAPMLECFMQTPTDPSLAPPGKHILSVFAQYYPYDRADGWTERAREEAADRIVSLLAQYAPNIPGAIEARQVLSPLDLEQRFGLAGGHIFHGELLPGQIYEDRFATRTPLAGLYLCGSGAHPGGCVSGFPGKRAAAAIQADLNA
ncbi:MAG: NAD(P)/FAD-dependent oxidoreductase [Candidatus Baltobacteraceae bacterium]